MAQLEVLVEAVLEDQILRDEELLGKVMMVEHLITVKKGVAALVLLLLVEMQLVPFQVEMAGLGHHHLFLELQHITQAVAVAVVGNFQQFREQAV